MMWEQLRLYFILDPQIKTWGFKVNIKWSVFMVDSVKGGEIIK